MNKKPGIPAICRRCLTAAPLLLLLSVNTWAMERSVPSAEVSPLLRIFAASVDANVDRLDSWTGQYELTESSARDNPWIYVQSEENQSGGAPERRQLQGLYLREQRVQGEFVADVRNDKLYSTYHHIGDTMFRQLDGDGGFPVPMTPETTFRQDSILTSEDFLHVRQDARFSRVEGFPELPEAPGGFRMLERESPEEGHRLTRQSTVFDPRRLLESGGRPHDVIFNALADWMDTGELRVSIVQTASDTWQVSYQFTNGDTTTKTVTESDAQFLVTESVLTSASRGVFRNVWEYDIAESVAVPVKHEYTHYSPDGHLRRGRKSNLLEIRVNEPVSDDEFLASRLNPAPLDRFVDRINDSVQVFVNKATRISAADFRPVLLPAGTQIVSYAIPQPPRPPELSPEASFTIRHLLITANLGMIVVAALTFFWQRLRRPA